MRKTNIPSKNCHRLHEILPLHTFVVIEAVFLFHLIIEQDGFNSVYLKFIHVLNWQILMSQIISRSLKRTVSVRIQNRITLYKCRRAKITWNKNNPVYSIYLCLDLPIHSQLTEYSCTVSHKMHHLPTLNIPVHVRKD